MSRRQEKGTVLLEAVWIFWLFILLFINLIDVGSYLISHILVTQAVREAVRTAAMQQDLEPGTYINAEGGCAGTCPNQAEVHNKLRTLFAVMASRNMWGLTNEPAATDPDYAALRWNVTTSYDAVTAMVTVEVNLRFHGLFLLDDSPIRAQHTGPYVA